MGRRIDVLNAYTAALQNYSYTNATLPPRGVARGFKWLDSVNEFPYITYNVQDSALVHISNNIRYYAMDIALRAYVRGEDAQALLDQLMLDIEDVTNNFASTADRSLEIVEAGIQTTHSDEGLMTPYGVTDMRIRITYQQNITI
jgi:hypothetical protein